MTDTASTGGTGLLDKAKAAYSLFDKIPEALVLFIARITMIHIFWTSAGNKLAGLFELKPFQAMLFESEFGMPFPEVTAVVTAWAEYALPFLLLIGFASRLAATGILIMTLVIQFYVFGGADDFWAMMMQTHILWAAPMLVIMKYGPGSLSVDAILKKTVFAK
ncbi:hypothetical protein JCM17844_10060 [Iodidimonas gelatinilytica]|uniref:DoxX family protein n=2 Tax=Iodidimonas TaxID=2066486 RepID=A0A5A7MR64_9PROT|nr:MULTISPECIES: DoxX family protein [Iodidimonas]GEQ97369.1 hypothetical protein JCM17844_10060 [Iodidimonas gelatinilytica]GEQ99694.1 hypothetical protein JCM17845_03180 [Iodidimonas gelatinilytica]GER07196.1 hypothetical protein JCM17843_15060 [Kordiimonadales bacterium JCM 17843]GGO11557.1 hypothetical protein GCM10007972_15440 [Iodidimonas muriae]